MVAPFPLPLEVPDLAAGAGVDRPHVIGNRNVGHAVDHKRRGLDRSRALRGQAIAPGEAEMLDVVGRDLRQRAESASAVVAVVGRPASLRIDARALRRLQRECQKQESELVHFSDSRYATTSWMFVSVIRGSSATCAANGSFLTIRVPGVRPTVR